MTNQERKLFNISNEIEKILYDKCGVIFFNKEIRLDEIQIFTGRKTLGWIFIEPFTDFTKKNQVNFEIEFDNEKEVLSIKIWN